ncbi:hypothetical protein ACFYTC_06695 [Actinomadura nitritigenes]|uniref:hypothetical protein n=1 Tax=Actinomadura nitritigenes TaxID=134602 RepID=UPI0036CE131C
MSDLVLIAVPNRLLDPADVPGHEIGRPAVLRVVVVPRLDGDSLTAEGLDGWPQVLLDDLDFRLYVKNPAGVRAARFRPVLYDAVADQDVWDAVFRGDAARLFAGLREPDRAVVTPRYGDAQRIGLTYSEASEVLAEPDGTPDLARYLQPWAAVPPPEPPRDSPLLDSAMDFRRTFGLIREHPEVLRDLGLVFELLIDADELDGGDRLSVRASGTDLVLTSPWTWYELATDGFWPGADPERAGDIRRGVVDLSHAPRIDLVDETRGTPPWAIATFDVDGGVIGLRAAARLLASGTGTDPSGPSTPNGPGAQLPALRSAGLMLIRPDRQREFEDRLDRASLRARNRVHATDGNAEDELDATELVLGYRVDVFDADDLQWRSLCAREAVYSVLDAAGDRIEIGTGRGRREEGHVKHLAAVRGEDGVARADEIVVRWDGWSLAVPPPELAHRPDRTWQAAAPRMAAPYNLDWSFDVPEGALPRLRFGRRYRLRVRVADIAGGGPDLDAVADDRASDEIAYRRAEPVAPPRLYVDSAPLPGAAVDRLVIRSDQGMTADEFAAAEPRYAARDACTLHPPAAAFALIEQHGVLDSMTDAESWRLAAQALRIEPGDQPALSLPDPAAAGVAAYAGGPWSAADWRPWPGTDTKTVMVGDHVPESTPVALSWENGDRLRIDLAPGESADVELSSTITPDLLPHFAVHEWLGPRAAPGGVTSGNALRGRHPLLSPPVTVHAVHAVRRPRIAPVWRELQATRGEGDTAAIVTAEFAENGLHTASTGRVEVAAAWEEWSDDSVRPMTAGHVHDQDVDRDQAPRLRFAHQFGDTRHRDVTYTAKAVSRYRPYFAPEDPPQAFELTGEPRTVVVPSSARPPKPEVLAVLPGFRWSAQTGPDRIVRRRSGNRLVVELARPWYATGAGECLGVVASESPGDAAQSVTELAGDPVYASPRVGRYPGAEWFGGEARSLRLPGGELTASVIACPVALEGDAWRAEVVLTPPADMRAYRPFVRLAVARYQPYSLPALELSPVVTTERVPLLPDREIVVEHAGGRLLVRVHGVGPQPPNRVEVGIDEAPDGGPAPELIAVDPAADPGLPAWRPLPAFTRTGDASGTPIELPLPPGGRPLRLRVREVEDLTPLGDLAAPAEGLGAQPPELTERTVLIDHIPIPGGWLPEGDDHG